VRAFDLLPTVSRTWTTVTAPFVTDRPLKEMRVPVRLSVTVRRRPLRST
jgi:hypothetical protein